MKKLILQDFRNTLMPAGMLFSCLGLLSSCISMAPVNSNFESAKTLARGQIELMGNYSTYKGEIENEITGNKSAEKVNNNFGFRVGYGITDRFDIKTRYERLIPALQNDKDQLEGINFISVSPRYGIIKERLAAAIDFGWYQAKLKGEESVDDEIVFTPKLAFTFPSSKYFDLTLSTRIDLFTEETGDYWGWNLGCGISSDLNKWALRPEFGIMFDASDLGYGVLFHTWGLALVLKFDTLKK